MTDEELLQKAKWIAIIQLAIIGCDSLIVKSTKDEESIRLTEIKMKLKEELAIRETAMQEPSNAN